ncbi:MAG: hypothetical protein QOI71_3687 [Gaiellales bacterium]|jgi:hypothetical protein|nr:hypothetical protein [Gaiellales bacterium]MDX6618433.1 hypothetical protein [Gaiellales bacterium]
MSSIDSTSNEKLKEEIEQLKTAMAVQEATMAGAQSTQAATQAGQAATSAAAAAGTWSTFVVGGVALSVGMFLAVALVGAARK